jgi:D-xylose 1-dehydrogenase (NADP+, D-xylono-1,5-lactone-forming)
MSIPAGTTPASRGPAARAPAAQAPAGSVGFGVIGAGSMVAQRAVLPALDVSDRAHLVALCSLSGPPSDRWIERALPSYEDVIDHPDVEVVYVPLPNAMHVEWVARAAAAGKHVLCEKPLAMDADEARAMAETCERAGVQLAEAWMTPFDPRWRATFGLIDDGLIGDVTRIEARFTFTIGPDRADNYRWSPALGGGALLDVGIYCLGGAVRLWGSDPEAIAATRVVAPSGVDATSDVRLTWPGGRTARITCSFVDAEQQLLRVTGERGMLELDGLAHTGGVAATSIRHTDEDGAERIITVEGGDPYLAMIDAFAVSVRGVEVWPRPVEDSARMLALLGRIRQAAA